MRSHWVRSPARATLVVLDAAGRRIRTLTDGAEANGPHALAWDLRDDLGSAVRGGLCFVRTVRLRARVHR